MREEVVDLLNNLNRKFYDVFADAFATSRAHMEPGLTRILADVQPGDHVLDLGCGHGRVAAMLPARCTYVGMDFSVAMLDVARTAATTRDTNVQTRFVIGDLLADEWPAQINGPHDWIVLRAVLHHIPGAVNRLAIVRRAAALLASGGHLLIANWQFLDIARLRRRILPWVTIGLTATSVEPGDYLLDWQREGYGIRYVHLVDEDETRTLAAAAGLHLDTMFRADGHNNNLTLYAVLRAQ